MPRRNFAIIVVIILAAFLGVSLFVKQMGNNYSGPARISVSEEIGDLGEIGPEQPQSHIFTIKNEGGESLVIERVQAPCSCTATVLSEETLLPGKSTELEVTFNPSGYEGDISQSVYIYSNDPENPRQRLVIKANVKHIPVPKIHLSTTQWELGLLSSGDSPTIGVSISNQGDIPLEIENIVLPSQIDYEQEAIELPIELAPDEEIELSFIIDSSGLETGILREYIRLITNEPNKKNVTLRIEGYVQEKREVISIYPLEKNSSKVKEDSKQFETSFLIKNSSDYELKQISILPSENYLVSGVEEFNLNPGEEKEVTIKIQPAELTGPIPEAIKQELIYFKIAIPVNNNLISVE